MVLTALVAGSLLHPACVTDKEERPAAEKRGDRRTEERGEKSRPPGYFAYESRPMGNLRFRISIPSDFGSNEWPDGRGVIIGKNEIPDLQMGVFAREEERDISLDEYVDELARRFEERDIQPILRRESSIARYRALRIAWTYDYEGKGGEKKYVFEDSLYALHSGLIFAANMLTRGETAEEAERLYHDHLHVFEEILSSIVISEAE